MSTSEESVHIILRNGRVDDFKSIEPLWHGLYQHQFNHGMLLTLPADAYKSWSASMIPMLGRFSSLVVAELSGKIVGFVAGRIRTLPPYFGSGIVGTISEVFVTDEYRGRKIGTQLLELSIEWFKSQQITRIELQVVAGNMDGIHFYRRLGWHQELVQMVWDAS